MGKAKVMSSREKRIFSEQPIWKSVLQMSLPSLIAMLVFGLYSFIDSILSIQFASDNYEGMAMPGQSAKDLVRVFMTATVPITTFIMAITLLFGVGVARRVSVNIGAGNEERAIKTMKTSMQFSLLVSLLLIPILLFSAIPWMESQFDSSPKLAGIIAENAYQYVWIIIMALPIMMFNQVATSLLRTEARNKEAVLAMLIPLLVNLFFDWLFMGPLGMGVNGGAWATFISYVLTAAMYVFFISRKVESRIKWKNLFGRKNFQLITLVGVILVGIAPFLRNMAQSITQTFEMNQIQSVSKGVYDSKMAMTTIMTSVFPIFGLFFPIMFGFVQAGSPLAAYNFGAKDMKRVKQTVMWVVVFSFITGIILYLLSTFALFDTLSSWLGNKDKVYDSGIIDTKLKDTSLVAMHPQLRSIKNWAEGIWKAGGHSGVNYHFTFHAVEKAQKVYGIMMLGLPLFSVVLGAMVLFGSTDRISLSIFAASLRGIILLIPILLIFSAIAKESPGDVASNVMGNNGVFASEFIFWWFYPVLLFITTFVLGTLALFTMKRIGKKEIVTIDARIEKLHTWARAKRKAKKVKNT